jgi:hypothetical protein
LSPGSMQTSKEDVIILFRVLLLFELAASAKELLKINVRTNKRTFYSFFWMIPRRLNFMCWRFGTLCLFHLLMWFFLLTPSMKMELTECSETSEHKIQTPRNHPKEIIQHSGHSVNLKSKLKETFTFAKTFSHQNYHNPNWHYDNVTDFILNGQLFNSVPSCE